MAYLLGIKAVTTGNDNRAQFIHGVIEVIVHVFIVPPSIAALEQRLRSRGQDSDEIIARRMRDARNEVSHYGEYDYLIVNDNFENTVEELRAIIIARRHRLDAQQIRHQDVLQNLLDEG